MLVSCYCQINKADPHYLNLPRWKKEQIEESEMVPLNSGKRRLSIPDMIAPGFNPAASAADDDDQVGSCKYQQFLRKNMNREEYRCVWT